MKKSVLMFLVAVLLSGVAAAQDAFQIYGGYQYMRTDLTDCSCNNHGWDADFALRVANNVSLVGDVSGSYDKETVLNVKGKTRLYNYLFGPRVSAKVGKFVPFGEALVGLTRASASVSSGNSVLLRETSNGFGIAIGGGIDVNAGDHLAFRLAKLDYMVNTVNFESGSARYDDTLHNLRYSTGIVLRF